MLHDRVITMLHDPCQHNAPEFLSSQCSMTVSSQCYMTLVNTVLHDLYHHNALCRFSSQVFVSVRGLSPVVASGGHSSSRCAGLSLSRPLLLWSTGSRRAGSVVVAHGPSRSTACGIFPDQGSNPCPLHWQADCQPLRHQGSPVFFIFHWIRAGALLAG